MQVYEGARPMARDNRLLGRVLLDGIPRKPRGQEVVVVFSMEKSGALTVAVKNSGTTETLTIAQGKGRETDAVRWTPPPARAREPRARRARVTPTAAASWGGQVERAIKEASQNREADEGIKASLLECTVGTRVGATVERGGRLTRASRHGPGGTPRPAAPGLADPARRGRAGSSRSRRATPSRATPTGCAPSCVSSSQASAAPPRPAPPPPPPRPAALG